MKKIFNIIAALACVGSLFTACEESQDLTDPKAQQPTDNNFLNTPPTANYLYDLSETESVTLTLSQPDYGVGTVPTYAVQLSLDPEFDGVPTQWLYNGAESTPQNYIELPSTYTTTTITIAAREVADAINGCRGYNKLDQLEETGYTDYEGPIYLRVRSYFPGASDEVYDLYNIISNAVKLNYVKAYPTIRVPGYIFLVGAPEGWSGPTPANAEHYEDWKLFEADDKIGSEIYSATFDIPAGQFQFRFYSKLQDWDNNSIGSQDGDSPVDITLNDNGIYSGSCVVGTEKGKGKGSWQIPDWAGGEVTITVNIKAKTVEFKKI